MEQEITQHDFSYNIKHQEKYSRLELLLRSFFGFLYIIIPHGFLLFFLSIAAVILGFLAWFAVLFTAQYPKTFFDFRVNLLRWTVRVGARMLHLSDGYPAFGLEAQDDRIELHVAYPEKLSRGILLLRTFFGVIYVMIPHGICLMFRMLATYVLIFIAWWAVLFTGKYPKGLHDFVVGTLRWSMRVNIYMAYLTDKYPPFTGK